MDCGHPRLVKSVEGKHFLSRTYQTCHKVQSYGMHTRVNSGSHLLRRKWVSGGLPFPYSHGAWAVTG